MKIININAIWCSGCLSMKKIWKQIKKEYENIEIINYDYDIDKDKIKEYNVGTVLPVTIFKNKKEEKRLIGEQSKETIEKVIHSYNEE